MKLSTFFQKLFYIDLLKVVILNKANDRARDRVRDIANEIIDKFISKIKNETENDPLRSQSVILETGRGMHSKYKPFAFTEQGVAMLSSVLNSDPAIMVNIRIIRVFTKMRKLVETHEEILQKLEQLEIILWLNHQ